MDLLFAVNCYQGKNSVCPASIMSLIRYDSCVEIQVHKLVFLWAYRTKTTELSCTKLVDGLGPENTSLTFAADLGSGMDAGISSCFFKMGCFFCFVGFFWTFLGYKYQNIAAHPYAVYVALWTLSASP